MKFCKIALYADDTVLYLANPDFGKAVCRLQEDMSALNEWCLKNGIRMNIDKTNTMVFGTQKRVSKLPPFEITIDKVPIPAASTYRYLGVTLDSQINYNKHVKNVISKVSLKIKQLRRMRFFLDTKAALLVYKNMILPLLEYGDIFLEGVSVENRRKLQVLQNKGLRSALQKDRFTSTVDLHAAAKIGKLNDRRGQHVLSYMFDMAQTRGNLKTIRESGVKTRSQNKKLVKIRKPITEKFKKSLTYRGPKRWNDLPESFHHLNSRSLFNDRIKRRVVKTDKTGNGVGQEPT